MWWREEQLSQERWEELAWKAKIRFLLGVSGGRLAGRGRGASPALLCRFKPRVRDQIPTSTGAFLMKSGQPCDLQPPLDGSQ